MENNIVNLNLGSADRKLSALGVAPVLIVAGILVGPAGLPAVALYALAGVMAGTCAAGTCPLYMIFGVRTCPLKKVSDRAAERVAVREPPSRGCCDCCD